jgi:RimJ/RimL family protein N-acetyltransferase/catechol 2,3-dioxygenase-like lactoylglutathione lyase family enzyme
VSPPFRAAGIDHVVLRVAEMERALAFYCGVLGLREERRIPDSGIVQLRAGAAIVDLLDAKGAPAAGPRAMDHFCLRLERFDAGAVKAHLAAHGVAVLEEGRRYGAQGFGPSVYVRDADGNTVELKGAPEKPAPLDALPVLATARLVLRPLTADDAVALFPTLSDPESCRYWWHEPHRDLAETRAHLVEQLERTSAALWAITREGGAALGYVSVYSIEGPVAEIGYIADPVLRGGGHVTEAAMAARNWAFEALGISRLSAILSPENPASRRVLEKLGFVLEGITREDYPMGGRMHDTMRMGLLRREWEALKR